MNTSGKFLPALPIIALAVLFLPSSCSKDSGGISETDLILAQDDAYSYALYEEVDDMIMNDITSLDAGEYLPVSLKSTLEETPCYTVDVDFPDSTRFPKVITFDYGDGCTIVFRDDTITRKGKIQVTVTDRWFIEGAQNILTFIDFSINDVSIEGTRTITNQGFNEAGHLVIVVMLENGKVVFPDSAVLTMDADYQKEWIRHRTPLMDTLLVTGNAAGVNALGEEFSRVITTPLVLVHCLESQWRWVIVDGSVEITNSATGTTTIDYKAEGCDGTVIVNKNGYHHNYPFRYNHRQLHRHGGH